jgi:hypothetical protein
MGADPTGSGGGKNDRTWPVGYVMMELRFLYVGSSNTERDVATWLALPGARLRWRFQNFGADVAAVDLGVRPLVLIADHRPAGTVLPIYAVADLDAAGAELREGGWTLEMGPMESPEGPATVWHDASGAAIALMRIDRPDMLDSVYTGP